MSYRSSKCCGKKHEAGRESCCSADLAAAAKCGEQLPQQQQFPLAATSQHADVLQQQEQHQRLQQQQEQQQEQQQLPQSLMCETTYQVKIDSTTVWQVPTRLKFVKKIGSGAYGCVASFEENVGRSSAAGAGDCGTGEKESSGHPPASPSSRSGSVGGSSSSEGRAGTPAGHCCGGGTAGCSSCGSVGREERSKKTTGKDEDDGAGPKKKRLAVKKIGDLFRDLIDAKRIYREIKILKEIKHENIISLVEILDPLSPDFDDIYLVSDLMDTDLHRVIYSRQTLTTEHHQYFLYQLLLGLSFLHQAEIIHRDLKPSNILVNLNCDIKICDFGLARGLHMSQAPPPSPQQESAALSPSAVRCCYCCCAAGAADAHGSCSSSSSNSCTTTTSASSGGGALLPTGTSYTNHQQLLMLRMHPHSQPQQQQHAQQQASVAAAATATGRPAAFSHHPSHHSASARLVPGMSSGSGSSSSTSPTTAAARQRQQQVQPQKAAAAAANCPQSAAGACCCGCDVSGTAPHPAAAFACEEAARNLELTDYVVTRWYRPPEILISPFCYSKPVDLWSVGCIFAELLGRRALFAGKDHFDQLRKIIRVMGRPSSAELNKVVNEGRSYPIYTSSSSRRYSSKCACGAAAALSERAGGGGGARVGGGGKDSKGTCRHCRRGGEYRSSSTKHKRSDAAKKFIESLPYNEPYNLADLFPDASAAAIDLLSGLLAFDPENRMTVQEALRHEYFDGLHSPEDEPRVASPVDWSFDNFTPTKRLLQNKVYEEILSFHPEIVLRDFAVLPSRGILISPASLPPHVRTPLALLQQRAATAASAAAANSNTSRSSSFSSVCLPSVPAAEPLNLLQRQQQQQALHPQKQQQQAQQQLQSLEVAYQRQQEALEQQEEQPLQPQQHRQAGVQQQHWQQQTQLRQQGQEQVVQQVAQPRQVQQPFPPQQQQEESDEKRASLSARCRDTSGRSQRRPQEELRTVADQQQQHLSPTAATATATAADRSSVTTSASSLPCCSSPDSSAFAELSVQQQQHALLRLLPAPAATASSTSALSAASPAPAAAAAERPAAAADPAERTVENCAAAPERCAVATRGVQPDEAHGYFSSFPPVAAVYDHHIGGTLQQSVQKQQQHNLSLQHQQQHQLQQQLHQPHQQQQYVQQQQQYLQQQQQEKGFAGYEGRRGCSSAGFTAEASKATVLGAGGRAAAPRAREDFSAATAAAAAAGCLSPHAAAATKCSQQRRDWSCSSDWEDKRSSIRRRDFESSSAPPADSEAAAVDAAAAVGSSLPDAAGGDAELLTALHMLQGCQNSSTKSSGAGENGARRTTAGSRPSTNPSASLSSLPRTATSFSLPSVQSLTPCCPEHLSTTEQQRGNVACCASSLTAAAASSSTAAVHEEDVFACACSLDRNPAAAAAGASGLQTSGTLVEFLGGSTSSSSTSSKGSSQLLAPLQQSFYRETAATPAAGAAALPGGGGTGGGGGAPAAMTGAAAATTSRAGTAAAAVGETDTGRASWHVAAGAREATSRGEEESSVNIGVPSWRLEDRVATERQETSSSSAPSTESLGETTATTGDSPSSAPGVPHAAGEIFERRRPEARLDGASARPPLPASPASTSYASPPTYVLPAYSQLLPGAAPPPLAHEHQQRRHPDAVASDDVSGVSCCSVTGQQRPHGGPHNGPHGGRGEDGSEEAAAGATLLLLAATRDAGSDAPALLASAAPVESSEPQRQALPFFSAIHAQQQSRDTQQHQQQRLLVEAASPWARQPHTAQQQSVQHPPTVPIATRQYGGHQYAGLFSSLHPPAAPVPPQSSIDQQQQPSLPLPFECPVNTAAHSSSSTCFQQRAATAAAQSFSPAGAATSRNSVGSLARGVCATSTTGSSRGSGQSCLAPFDAFLSDPQHQQQQRAVVAAAAVVPTRRASALEADRVAARSQSDSSCGGCCCAVRPPGGGGCCSPLASSLASTSMHVSQLGSSICSHNTRSRSKPEPPAAATAAFAVSMGSEHSLRPADSAAFLFADFNRRDKNVCDVPVFSRPGETASPEETAAVGLAEAGVVGAVATMGPTISGLSCGTQNMSCWREEAAACSSASLAAAAAAVRPMAAAAACSSSTAGRSQGIERSMVLRSNHQATSCSDGSGHAVFLLEGAAQDGELRLSEEQHHEQQATQLAAAANGSIFTPLERVAQQREATAIRAAFLQGVYALQQRHEQEHDGLLKQQERSRAARADVGNLRGSQQQDVVMGESEDTSSNSRSRCSRDRNRCSGGRHGEEETAVLCAAGAAGTVSAAAEGGGRGGSSCCMDVDFFLQQEAAEQTLLLSAIREQQQQQMQRIPARGGSYSEHATQLLLHENHLPGHGLQKQHAHPPGHHVKS